MLAFQIHINGKPYCESDDITVVTMVAEELQHRDAAVDRVTLHAGGPPDSPLQWLLASLGAGDEVVIRIVDAEEVEDAGPAACSFCGREVHDVHSLLQGQSAAICDRCVVEFSAALKNATPLPLGGSIRDESEWRCGFCVNRPGGIPGVIVRNGSAICPECLRACSDIQAERPSAED